MQKKVLGINTSDIELNNILKAWVAISLAFAIVLSDGPFSTGFSFFLLLAAVTVGLGFLLHELAHKLVAQRYGCFAEFRSFNFMLVLAVLLSFLGFVFAAPGAVMIQGHVNRERNGIISIAGPLVNIALAVIFLVIGYFMPNPFSTYGALINAWLAAFNMIPFGPLDGAKILRWNKVPYFITLIVAIGLLIISNII
jgi:Zn-dependent protease